MKRIVVLLMAGFLFNADASDVRVEGGKIDLNGKVAAENVSIGAGAALQGSGIVDGSGDISGTVSPGNGTATDVNTISFTGDLEFQNGSAFESYASDHTTLDKLQAGGTVSGNCDVTLTKAAGAIPLHQVIIDGGASSDYDLFDDASADWNLKAVPVGDLEVTELTGDTDADDLPDWWEFDYFADRTAAGAGDDDDDDLMFNWQELVAGTNPTNPSSRLIMQAVENRSKTNLVISWQSVAGKLYSLYSRTNLAAGAGVTNATNIAATPPVNVYTNTVPAWERLYYRIEVQQ